MALLENTNAIGHDADSLGGPGSLGGRHGVVGMESGAVEQVHDIPQAGISRQMHAVGLEFGGRKAINEVQVCWAAGGQNCGKLDQDLWEPNRIPVRSNPVHRR